MLLPHFQLLYRPDRWVTGVRGHGLHLVSLTLIYIDYQPSGLSGIITIAIQ
jgi:hypothetical protein